MPRYLTDAKEKGLVYLSRQGNQEAINSLVAAYMPLINRLAKRHRKHGLDFEDLVHDGVVGLIGEALERYDERKGRFGTYAFRCIATSMWKGINESGQTIRVPSRMVDRIYQIWEAERYLFSVLERPADDEEICTYLNISRQKLETAYEAMKKFRPVSLDAEIGNKEKKNKRLAEILQGKAEDDTEACAMRELNRRTVSRLLYELHDEAGARILRMRFGEEEMSLRQVAGVLGKSYEYVRKQEAEAFKKLKRIARGKNGQKNAVNI